MKKRVISVPKDVEAARMLDYDRALSDQLIELELDEELFYLLWREQIFEIINEAGDSNIDDYEDDVVIGEGNILQVICALKLKENSINDELNELVVKIRHLFEEALRRGTGVYFFF